MKKRLLRLLGLLALAGGMCHAKVVTLQVTIGAGVTKVIPAGDIICKWVAFQNNAANTMRIGDSAVSSTRGIKLVTTQSFYQGTLQPWYTNLSSWYVQGTQGDVLDIIYDDGQ